MTLEHKLLLPVPVAQQQNTRWDSDSSREIAGREQRSWKWGSEPPRGTSVSGWILSRKAWFIMGDVLPAGIHRLVLTEAINTKADHLIGNTSVYPESSSKAVSVSRHTLERRFFFPVHSFNISAFCSSVSLVAPRNRVRESWNWWAAFYPDQPLLWKNGGAVHHARMSPSAPTLTNCFRVSC